MPGCLADFFLEHSFSERGVGPALGFFHDWGLYFQSMEYT